jgi:flavin-dependent dehydrogenase
MTSVETIIIGGGPAGSSCAWELNKQGRKCLILERQSLPKKKLCAGWITPRVLEDLEIEPRAYPHGLMEIDRIRIYFGLTRFSVVVPTRQYSLRRVEFDNWLLDRCQAEVVRHQARLIIREDDGFVIDGQFQCRYLVGAGGTACPVKKTFFGSDRGDLVITQEIEYEAATKGSLCSLFYPFEGLSGYGWFVPKMNGINIGYGGVAAQFNGNIKSYWQKFVKNLAKRGLIDGTPPEPSCHPYYLGDREKAVSKDNAFIVGDAAGLATMDMGEGIGPAVESGLMAAREILSQEEYSLDRITKYSLGGLGGKLVGRFMGAQPYLAGGLS